MNRWWPGTFKTVMIGLLSHTVAIFSSTLNVQHTGCYQHYNKAARKSKRMSSGNFSVYSNWKLLYLEIQHVGLKTLKIFLISRIEEMWYTNGNQCGRTFSTRRSTSIRTNNQGKEGGSLITSSLPIKPLLITKFLAHELHGLQHEARFRQEVIADDLRDHF